jgi:uncharacterized protein
VRKALVLLSLCAAVAALAADFGALAPRGFVSDFAGVIDADALERLEKYCTAVERSTGVELALVTLPNLAGEPVEDVANLLYRKWGVGKKGKDEGALLLLSIQDRRSRLEVGYGLEPILTDGDAGVILRAMRPYLREGRYGDAMLQAAHEIGSTVARAKNVSIQEPSPVRSPRRESEAPLPAALLFGGLVLFAVLSSLIGGRRRRRRSGAFGGILPGLILGNLVGRSIDFRRGGGGFGGFDSSDGFGGFGGGDSGGGGASSSW